MKLSAPLTKTTERKNTRFAGHTDELPASRRAMSRPPTGNNLPVTHSQSSLMPQQGPSKTIRFGMLDELDLSDWGDSGSDASGGGWGDFFSKIFGGGGEAPDYPGTDELASSDGEGEPTTETEEPTRSTKDKSASGTDTDKASTSSGKAVESDSTSEGAQETSEGGSEAKKDTNHKADAEAKDGKTLNTEANTKKTSAKESFWQRLFHGVRNDALSDAVTTLIPVPTPSPASSASSPAIKPEASQETLPKEQSKTPKPPFWKRPKALLGIGAGAFITGVILKLTLIGLPLGLLCSAIGIGLAGYGIYRFLQRDREEGTDESNPDSTSIEVAE